MAVAVAFVGTVLVSAPSARAAPAAKPKTAASTGAARAKPKPKPKPRARKAPQAEAAPKPAAPTPEAAGTSDTRPAAAEPAAAEAPVGAADGSAKRAADVVKTEADRSGVTTYTFGAQEVTGRLKSPQLLYFLRRVRAQFDSAPLGHRSFLLELSDTRRHPALD
jgi:hypothetical protein